MHDSRRRFSPTKTATLLIALGLLVTACGGTDSTATPLAPTADAAPTAAPPRPTSAPTDDIEMPSPTSAPTDDIEMPSPTSASADDIEIPDSLELTLTPLLDIDLPIALATRAGSGNLFIATKTGQVFEISIDVDAATIVRELIDIGPVLSAGNEQGLLGLTFSPSGSDLFLDYTDGNGDTNVVAITMDGDELDLSTTRTLLLIDQPRSNHNGGAITFGPDGFLYVALGDGGGGGDPFVTGQDPGSFLGSILRIAPEGDGYAIPIDNPFAEGGGAPEVFIYGVRNPWRFSFDATTGDMWIADVGQDALEEITVIYASSGDVNGANLGWSDVEGTAPFNAGGPPRESYVGPIYEYGRSDGCSITGGYVYRGQAIPELSGIYVFGDFCTSRLWGFASSENQGPLGRFELGVNISGQSLASFGEGPDGELYVLSFEGVLYRIDPV